KVFNALQRKQIRSHGHQNIVRADGDSPINCSQIWPYIDKYNLSSKPSGSFVNYCFKYTGNPKGIYFSIQAFQPSITQSVLKRRQGQITKYNTKIIIYMLDMHRHSRIA